MGSTAVMMVGGPTKGTRFRPLSLTLMKPLFPIAGKPLVMHPVLACQKIPDLLQVVLIGFYPEDEMKTLDTALMSRELGVPVTYVQEESGGLGSAGGLHRFRDLLLQGNPDFLFVLNCDVCSDYPLNDMLAFHKTHGGQATLLVKRVDSQTARGHGAVVVEEGGKATGGGRVLHYAEKPGTLVSNTVNCGIYVFSCPSVFDTIGRLAEQKGKAVGFSAAEQALVPTSMLESLSARGRGKGAEDGPARLGMPDVFASLAESKQLYALESKGFWEQLKQPGSSLKFSRLYLSVMGSDLALARARLKGGPEVVGNVYIHPTAEVHPTAKIGPNVAIEAGAVISQGARVKDCIVLNDVQVLPHACIVNSIVGWGSVVGPWARIQGSEDYDAQLGVSILAEDVVVGPQVVVSSSVILPHKEIKSNVSNEIVL
ncbi:mannose-1-phosphate guanyltransferase [Chloropicon roscoffensis]|uniref:Mannose-1-phosphate guanyltransferase n=1 Tax=Chloropicon roscoffensis TaxID=1461544 RepID=A0AAX4P4U7_9CHLO|mmetsp:Transcript_4189/g.12644  ORF Transcript_4189/g.12644 Transcript_4189/m.12644 type:complete len:427 (-) Transcript_4189:42-1322(-)